MVTAHQRMKNARGMATLTAAHVRYQLLQLGMQNVESKVWLTDYGRGHALVLFTYRSERFSVAIEVDGGPGVEPRVHARAMVEDVLAFIRMHRESR